MAVETRQVMGVDVSLDPEVVEDWDVTRTLMKLTKYEGKDNLTDQDSVEMVESLERIMDLIYGDKLDKYLKKLRTANGGKLPTSLVWRFVSQTIIEFQKN